MNIAAFIENIKAILMKFFQGKGNEHIPTAKNEKVAKAVKSMAPKKDEKRNPPPAQSRAKNEGKKRTSMKKRPKTKR